MHIIGGILLLVVVFGVAFVAYTSGVFQPLEGPLRTGLGVPSASTTVASDNSEYHKEVVIQFVSLGSGLNQPMVLSLKGENNAKHEGIVLTGWKLKTEKGTYTIPKVANLYSPSVPGVPPEDIYLRDNGVVNMYSGKNPQGKDQAIRSGLGEWRIWLGEDFLKAPHGTVTLRDAKGKLVDEYKY